MLLQAKLSFESFRASVTREVDPFVFHIMSIKVTFTSEAFSADFTPIIKASSVKLHVLPEPRVTRKCLHADLTLYSTVLLYVSPGCFSTSCNLTCTRDVGHWTFLKYLKENCKTPLWMTGYIFTISDTLISNY